MTITPAFRVVENDHYITCRYRTNREGVVETHKKRADPKTSP
ncbi:hypothetical protein EBBID32_43550 [Sphingobium indicum BiD32]|uniref:Uncharacterized protein n=1 Tax=Sphingobium indicum BiD32 TaxID=1301087 RepID=N1MT96_9SPHN|nr:hypothetical protein EBBID32_43550 [Sphingobium indicum BiD32]